MNYLENISLKKLITLIKTEIKTNSGGSADRVTYDNTSSGLAGNNVQEAIDELADGVLPEDIVFCDEEDTEVSTVPLNADTVGGYTVDLLLDKIYPVGSIYMSLNSANPANLFGGTWEQIKDRFLLAAGDSYGAGSTGGEAEHTLTVDEMPSHKHVTPRQQWYSNDIDYGSGSIYSWKTSTGGSTSSRYTNEAQESAAGGSQPHNNMPPYLAVFMWQRTA